MKIKYQAKKGELYFGSLQPFKDDKYICNCLHFTVAGWIIEKDMIFKLNKNDFVDGEIDIPTIVTDEDKIFFSFVLSIADKFPESVTD